MSNNGRTGTQAKSSGPKSVSLALLPLDLLVRREEGGGAVVTMKVLDHRGSGSKAFLLLAPLSSSLSPTYCHSVLLWPGLWSGFFSWTSAWNFDLAVWPPREPAFPLSVPASPTWGNSSPESTELFSWMSLSSHLPSAQPHSHPARLQALTSGPQVSAEKNKWATPPPSVCGHPDGIITCAFWSGRFPRLPLTLACLGLITRPICWALGTSSHPSSRTGRIAELSECPAIFRTILVTLYSFGTIREWSCHRSKFPRQLKFGVSDFLLRILKGDFPQCSVYFCALLGQRYKM